MNFHTRFTVAFSFLAVIVALLYLAGLTPSAWTVAVMVAASLVLAYMTKPECDK
jgi:hypothetical protein